MPNVSLDDLTPNARDLAEQSLTWAERRWDPEGALLGSKIVGTPGESRLGVRNSVWTAVGFLLRNADGDTKRASRTIDAIIDQQFDEPGMPYHGTYFRYVGEPHPPGKDAVMWRDFDPNWRQFIGLGLATILEEFEHRLEHAQVKRIEQSLELAVIGEPPDRCPPRYTNIALMKAALNVWVGRRLGKQPFVDYGESFGKDVYELFKQTDAYDEYNSPTYYGTNFYALGFWRRYLEGSSIREMGLYMEAALWRDTIRYYHAGLKNLCGPFSRSYGMDMTRYTALVSLAFWLAFGREQTPFPEVDQQPGNRLGIDAEFAYGPCMAIFDSIAPDDVRDDVATFSGPRSIEKTITLDPRRIATAWLDEAYTLGAESTSDYSCRSYQHHAVTVHWRCPNGEIGWLRLKHIGPIDAHAEQSRIHFTAPVSADYKARDGDATTFTFVVYVPDVSESQFEGSIWALPGMTVSVGTSLDAPSISKEGETVEITYTTSSVSADFNLQFTTA